jgi:hypothetical protein
MSTTCNDTTKGGICKQLKIYRWNWKKPRTKFKRPLSAFNLFFQDIRRLILEKGNGTGGFSGLAKTVSMKWKSIEPELRSEYEERAELEKINYRAEVEKWKERERSTLRNQDYVTLRDSPLAYEFLGKGKIWDDVLSSDIETSQKNAPCCTDLLRSEKDIGDLRVSSSFPESLYLNCFEKCQFNAIYQPIPIDGTFQDLKVENNFKRSIQKHPQKECLRTTSGRPLFLKNHQLLGGNEDIKTPENPSEYID